MTDRPVIRFTQEERWRCLGAFGVLLSAAVIELVAQNGFVYVAGVVVDLLVLVYVIRIGLAAVRRARP